jgi:RNA polymerase sigma-70 factor (ECF subfamily)
VAEDCLQEAISVALQKWGKTGVPNSPQAWLLSVARRRAIDHLRRAKNFISKEPELALLQEEIEAGLEADYDIPDHRLRLIFTCCHPALGTSAQVALTLHTLGGLTTAEIARAYLITIPTMAQRITRAKNKIKQAQIPFDIPEDQMRAERVHAVLKVIYLIYNEGYSASQGENQLRIDLCDEALFLARMMTDLSTSEAEPIGLLALILFTHSRRHARLASSGAFIPLHLQDRNLWDKKMIEEGQRLLEYSLPMGKLGPYQLQAAIHGLHCAAKAAGETDWAQIAALYSLLARMESSVVIEVNQAVAMSFAGRPEMALEKLDGLEKDLLNYQPFFAAKADVLVRMGQFQKAIDVYDRAIELSGVDAENQYLIKQKSLCAGEA